MSKQEKMGLVPTLRFPEFRDTGEWDVTSIGQLGEVVTGCTPSTALPEYYGGDRLFVSPADISDGRFIEKTKTTLSAQGFRETRPIKANSILFVCIGSTIGKVAQNRHECATNQQINSVIPNSNNSDGFIYYALSGMADKIANLAGKHAVPIVNKSLFSSVELVVPKLPEEQIRIAACLSSIDELIASQTQKLATLKTHKKGLMQQLFPAEGEALPKLRFPEFRDAGEWVEKSIQKLIDEKVILDHLDGNHGELYPKAEEFSQDGIPYISANDFILGVIDFGKCKHLPMQRALKFKKGVAKDGDIIFAHNATVGPVAKLNTTFPFVILSTTATYFRCNNKYLNNNFLKFALSSPAFVKQYTRVMSQSTRNQVPITTQRKFNLQLPALTEQQKIADCLSSIDELIAAQSQKLDTLKTHKRGLMQQLFPSPVAVEA